jgi:hypothetical protein
VVLEVVDVVELLVVVDVVVRSNSVVEVHGSVDGDPSLRTCSAVSNPPVASMAAERPIVMTRPRPSQAMAIRRDRGDI